jgi:hypothetical protein
MSRDVAPDRPGESSSAGVSFRRAIAIERGEGPPPTDAEREAIAAFEARFKRSPAGQRLEKAATAMNATVATFDREGAVEAMRIYRAASPVEQRRMANLTSRQVLALRNRFQAGQEPGHGRPVAVAPRPREQRRARASRSGTARGSPGSRTSDDDPHHLVRRGAAA